MRKLLIVLVLVLTASAFYSALWFKSETIEADIRTRVTDDLAATDAANVEIDVDGRHVTLSGIVNDQATEAAYLQTADDTFGALGPIDGLTYQADGGYFTAVKTDDGITLRGTVATEDARTALVAQAQAATDGAVDDQLAVSGSAAAWQDEAGFGLTMLAGLSAGTLAVAADNFSVSGVADGDPADVTAAVADRAGWQAFVSSPEAEQQLSGDVARLAAEVSDRDATVEMLEEQVVTVTSERDMSRQELETLRGNLTEGETDTENLREQLIDTQSNLFEAEAAIEDRDQTVSALNGDVAALTEALAGSERRVTGADAMIAALSSNLADGGGEVSALSGQIEALQGQVSAGEADLGTANQQVLDLTGQVADRDATISGLTAQVADGDTALGDANQQVAALTAQVADGDTALGAANQQVLDLQGQVDLSNQAVVDLTAQLGDRDATIDGNVGAIADLTGQVASLNDTVTDRDATIASLEARSESEDTAEIAALNDQITVLEAEVAEGLEDGRAQVSALNGEIISRDATITALSGSLDQAESDVARLTRDVSDRDASVADASAQVSALTALVGRTEGEVDDLAAQVASLEGDVGDLTQVVAERDDTIAALQSQGVSSADVAQQCATRASAAMEGGRINFGSATAQIEQGSVELLERLTGIALACVGDGLSVEIGGHTDSQGTDAVNQELSEARALAVVDFMTARGVPAAGLMAVGYGESQPIADNGTPAGRADNRRISFDWQAR